MSEVLVNVQGVYKKFTQNLRRSMAHGLIDATKSIVGINRRSEILRPGEFWALENINFQLKRGEILGIVGGNGAGKSTLLRVLNGIFPPDAGRVEIRGGIGGLIALGAGFHPYMTGKENIFLNGTILGMSKAEITEKMSDIMDFADIGGFIDAPVSTYSSGMYARLAFSIAIHCVPDILLIDEVLSVGDFSFQNKCLRKIAELRENARGVIFVGHNMDMIETICDRAILLYQRKIEIQGAPLDVIARYRTISRELEYITDQKEFDKHFGNKQTGGMKTKWVSYLGAGLCDSSGKKINTIAEGQNINIYFDFESNIDIKNPQVGVGFSHPAIYPWNVAYDSNISNKTIKLSSIKQGGKYRITVEFENTNLIPGVYRINAMIRDGDTLEVYHHSDSEDKSEFTIHSKELGSFIVDGHRPSYNSIMQLQSNWSCKELN